MQKFYKLLSLLVLLAISGVTLAQDYQQLITSHYQKNVSRYNVSAEDVSDLRITDEVYTKQSKLTHVYAAQTVNGIPVRHASVNVAFKNGVVFYASDNLEKNIASRVNGSTPSFGAIAAANKMVAGLSLGSPNFEIIESSNNTDFVLSKGGVAMNEVPVKLVYYINEDVLQLAWDITLLPASGDYLYNTVVDARTGAILETKDLVLRCSFDSNSAHVHQKGEVLHADEKSDFSLFRNEIAPAALAGEQYRVYPLPVESPSHGERALITNPQDADASPFGWHDVNGEEGAEFTATRGNNTFARYGDDSNGGTSGTPSDGGDDLIFDFDLDLTGTPDTYSDASNTNLFYHVNITHDILYHYGLDEEGGAYQQTNYTGVAGANDAIFADAQDSSSTNNANFFPSPDGQPGLLQMFIFDASSVPAMTVDSPESVAGVYGLSSAAFGEPFPVDGLTGSLALAIDDDTTGDENDACDPLTNAADLDGKIAVVKRGECNFTIKVKAAQDAGAIAAIVINNVANPVINLGGNDATVTIPSGMISQSEGDALLAALAEGEDVVITVSAPLPSEKDGSFDNGIIAHEYGHGVSNRLAGGPNTTGCLGNAEQMGEGWSDFFGVLFTMEEGDTAEDIRGVGTFAVGQPISGQGIRPAAYSVDRVINDLTYGDTNNAAQISQPHGIGTVWATMLWDMTWALIDEYGFDDDIYRGTGGNNIALQLVMDGLKLQPCGAGFVTARDAIIAAVDINEDIAEEDRTAVKCMLWDLFAARGLGFSASQGSSASRTDQVEAFDTPPSDVINCNLSVSDVNTNIFKVYPNPSNGDINISIAQAQGEGSVTIYDINGRQVFNQKVSLEGTVNVQAQGLSTGIYILEINGASASQTTKLIIE
ncbi:T9SS C-terminal target domain-containing protein [Dokdonia sinensis]|uniref:T9SS C-terminal target domain-containing protein n=1 Tax=Dokdonia sinensis TaxID=2479847 RepID=A0A3M0GMS4_9FLAO|nr:T9SS-dependent M36 family metallopeptidase [Dokdonia sinensis]RMB58586.1 T9SS C-terminal target domain-containing protein [Dokdonia sinensis]